MDRGAPGEGVTAELPLPTAEQPPSLLKPFLKPLLVGGFFSSLMLGVFLGLAALGEASLPRALAVVRGDLGIVAAVMVSVGVSTGLMSYSRTLGPSKQAMGATAFGSATSATSMVSCCLHHFTDVLSSASVVLGTSASFLVQYRNELIFVGLGFNAFGSGLMVRGIRRSRRIRAEASASSHCH